MILDILVVWILGKEILGKWIPWVILVILVMSVILGHEKTKIQKIIDCVLRLIMVNPGRIPYAHVIGSLSLHLYIFFLLIKRTTYCILWYKRTELGFDKSDTHFSTGPRGRAEKEPRISIPVPAVPVSELLAGKKQRICSSLN